MTHKEDVKKDVMKSINYARNKANEFLEKDLDCTDVTRLTNVLSATEEVRSMALTLTRFFPKNEDIEHLWKEATAVYNLGYKGKERFVMQCKCYSPST
jgi:hypothetical protein